MLLSTSFNPFLNLQLPPPAIEDTTMQPFVAMCPSTPLPGDSADMDLLSTHDNPSSLLTSVSTDHNLSIDVEKLYSSIKIKWLWDRILQTNLTEDNGGLHTPNYHII
jgi:hypothetical protein